MDPLRCTMGRPASSAQGQKRDKLASSKTSPEYPNNQKSFDLGAGKFKEHFAAK